MPELPEVETTKNGLSPHIIGSRVHEVNIRFPTLRYPIPTDIPQLIMGDTLHNIIRRGKYLIFVFGSTQLIIHLGMSGKLTIATDTTHYIKHDHFEIVFSHNAQRTIMRLNDQRRFGCVLTTSDYTTHPLISSLGIEPLSESFTGRYLYQYSKNKALDIKQLIMNSKCVVGVGNIYAAESLFRSGIDPRSKAHKITKQQYTLLAQSIREVLTEAIASGGTTLKDYLGATGESGYFKVALNVYGRAGEACYTCGTPIEKITQAKRSTFYCPVCQKLKK